MAALRYEVIGLPTGEWRVECVRHDRDGEVEVTTFTGGDNERRAKDYAARMNRQQWGL